MDAVCCLCRKEYFGDNGIFAKNCFPVGVLFPLGPVACCRDSALAR